MAHKTVTAYQSAAIFFSSVIAAAATFAISVIAAYFLSHSEFRQFQSAFWPLVFGIYGITGAIQQETTRAVGESLLQNPESRTHTNRLSYSAVAALLGLGIAAIVVMTSPLWSSAFPTYPQMSVVLIAFGVVMYAVYAAVSGASAGRDSWYFYAALGSGEALIREVKEETNLTVKEKRYFCSLPNKYRYSDFDVPTLDAFFVCKVEDESVLKAADDVEEAMWLPLSEVHTEQFGLRSIRQALYDFLQMESKNLKK